MKESYQVQSSHKAVLKNRLFWLVVISIAATYFLVWVYNFRYLYGRLADDYYNHYHLTVLTAHTLLNVFRVGNGPDNASSALTWLPYSLGFATASSPILPYSSIDTLARYRFLGQYMVLLHSIILLGWGALYYAVTRNRTVSIVSLVVLSTSPSFILWTPYLDSRAIWMLVMLPAIYLLIRSDMAMGVRCRLVDAIKMALIGLLMSFASIVNYTSLYLTIPLVVTYFVGWFLHTRGRPLLLCKAAVSLTTSFTVLYGLYYAISYYSTINANPFMSPVESFAVQIRRHSGHSFAVKVASWQTFATDQMGLLMLAGTVVGAMALLMHRKQLGVSDINKRILITTVMIGGPLIILLPSSLPVFRQSVPFQPFLFLFTVFGARALACRIPQYHMRIFAFVLLLIVSCWTSWTKAYETFNAILSPGRMLVWLEARGGSRPVYWLAGQFRSDRTLYSWSELTRVDPSGWIVSVWPYHYLANNPSSRTILEEAEAIYASQHFLGTSTLRWEAATFGRDWTNDRLLGANRIVSATEILGQMPTIAVSQVLVSSGGQESAIVLQGSERRALFTEPGYYWTDDTDAPRVEIQFQESTSLQELQFMEPYGMRVSKLEVDGLVEGEWVKLWRHDKKIPRVFAQTDVIVNWQPVSLSALRLTIIDWESIWGRNWLPTYSGIKELSFPPYRVVFSDGASLGVLALSDLPVKAISVDSEMLPSYPKEKVFDAGVSPDLVTHWSSTNTPSPHYVEMAFVRPQLIDESIIINHSNTRIGDLEVQIRSGAEWATVFRRGDLLPLPEIRVPFPAVEMDAVRFVIWQNFCGRSACNVASIDEIRFPGRKAFVVRDGDQG